MWDTGRRITNKRKVRWTFNHPENWTDWRAIAWYGPGGNGSRPPRNARPAADQRDAAARALVQASNGVMLDVLENALDLIESGLVTTLEDPDQIDLARLARSEDASIRRQLVAMERSSTDEFYEAPFRQPSRYRAALRQSTSHRHKPVSRMVPATGSPLLPPRRKCPWGAPGRRATTDHRPAGQITLRFPDLRELRSAWR